MKLTLPLRLLLTKPSYKSVIPICSSFKKCPSHISEKFRAFSTNKPLLMSNERPLKLMKLPKIVQPNFILWLKNKYFEFLIRNYYDASFSQSEFLAGATQAITHVSSLISRGQFEDLEELVDPDSVEEIKRNYNRLSDKQHRDLKIMEDHIIKMFVHQIGMMFGNSGNVFVEITVVLHYNSPDDKSLQETTHEIKTAEDIIKAALEITKKVVNANYRFIKECTKGSESDWIINGVNHFSIFRNEEEEEN
ncbi:m-AAA protease-interacting protein 1, mitochondrial-like [Mytilus galloprovincialis]|uniref:Tim44-like domain-containing protein n=1 Tax=Mytilus galloprovincialis TaxID=29158 RepID=A0A8B6BQ23_MYTGA|nr:Hypothetical predicted protein [Mytilus galloprovincialis]